MQISPGTPTGAVRPETGSTILASVCGIAVPTVLTRRSMSSSRSLMNDTGAVSVMP